LSNGSSTVSFGFHSKQRRSANSRVFLIRIPSRIKISNEILDEEKIEEQSEKFFDLECPIQIYKHIEATPSNLSSFFAFSQRNIFDESAFKQIENCLFHLSKNYKLVLNFFLYSFRFSFKISLEEWSKYLISNRLIQDSIRVINIYFYFCRGKWENLSNYWSLLPC
jgi:hypothetical protein